jgi:hypothetical protein
MFSFTTCETDGAGVLRLNSGQSRHFFFIFFDEEQAAIIIEEKTMINSRGIIFFSNFIFLSFITAKNIKIARNDIL